MHVQGFNFCAKFAKPASTERRVLKRTQSEKRSWRQRNWPEMETVLLSGPEIHQYRKIFNVDDAIAITIYGWRRCWFTKPE